MNQKGYGASPHVNGYPCAAPFRRETMFAACPEVWIVECAHAGRSHAQADGRDYKDMNALVHARALISRYSVFPSGEREAPPGGEAA
jgi:hypothetical protein